MNDFKTIEDSYNSYLKAQTEANERNKAAVMDALTAAGITSVRIAFDGAGDSGQIEEVNAFIGDAPVEMPEAPVTDENVPLKDAIENLCYGYLTQFYDGWENNDGAFGEFTFDVRERSIHFEFNGRFTDYSTDTQTL